MTHSLAPINQLTPQASTQDLIDELTTQYLARSPALAQSRLTLETWADAFSQSAQIKQDITLIKQGETISIEDFLVQMDRPQVSRFLGELFSDIIPHFATKKRLLSDIASGKSEGGMKVESGNFLSRLAQFFSGQTEEEISRVATIEQRELTWIDDDARTIETSAEIVVGYTAESKRSPRY